MPESEQDGEEDGDGLRRQARLRETLLFKAYHRLVDSWPVADRQQCQLNRQLLRIVSESYFKDIQRKKDFHGIALVDEHKRAGYMIKWIMRFRPIQLTSEKCSVKALLANEHFAMTVAFTFLRISPAMIPPTLYKNLIYSLRFRLIDANAWALNCFLMQQAYGKPRDTSEGSPAP
jgi:hypothetical protein